MPIIDKYPATFYAAVGGEWCGEPDVTWTLSYVKFGEDPNGIAYYVRPGPLNLPVLCITVPFGIGSYFFIRVIAQAYRSGVPFGSPIRLNLSA